MDSLFVHDQTDLKANNDGSLIEDDVEQTNLITSNSVSIGTQCDWRLEQPDKSFDLLPDIEKSQEDLNALNSDTLLMPDKNYTDTSMAIRSWPLHCDSSTSTEQKILIPAALSQQYACNIPSSLEEENYLLKLDYKSRNKLKTKQRRMDPIYRAEERVRQRTVMRLKRLDPAFRATEREKGRYRMRLKRLDPEFRSQERERQRERMKAKRSDPEFREKEREQQKNRLHVKRLNPAFKEKERAQDKIRMLMKRQNSSFFTNLQNDAHKICSGNENVSVVSEKLLKDIYKSGDPQREFQNHLSLFPENFGTKLVSLKSRECLTNSFNFKKHHILNFSYYHSNKEQWSQEICPKTFVQFHDDQESDTSTTASLSDVNDQLIKKIPVTSKCDDGKTESSQPLVIVKSNEIPFTEAKKQSISSHSIDSPSEFLLPPETEN